MTFREQRPLPILSGTQAAPDTPLKKNLRARARDASSAVGAESLEVGKGKHDYWRKVTGKKDLPPRKTPRQKAIKKLVKKVAKKVAKGPKVANAKNPKKEAKKLVKKILPKVLQKAAVPKKDVKKLIKKAKQVVKKKTAPAGKRGLVANQEQTQNKGGRKRKRKRQGAGKWAKHGCKVTEVLFCTICLRALTACTLLLPIHAHVSNSMSRPCDGPSHRTGQTHISIGAPGGAGPIGPRRPSCEASMHMPSSSRMLTHMTTR